MEKENNTDESDFSENEIPDWNSLNPFEFERKTRKATGFNSLRLKYWEINQAKPKCQIDFWTKLAKQFYNRKSEHQQKILHIQISILLST